MRVFALTQEGEKRIDDGEQFYRGDGRLGLGRERQRQQIRHEVGEKGLVEVFTPDRGEIGEKEIARAKSDFFADDDGPIVDGRRTDGLSVGEGPKMLGRIEA